MVGLFLLSLGGYCIFKFWRQRRQHSAFIDEPLAEDGVDQLLVEIGVEPTNPTGMRYFF